MKDLEQKRIENGNDSETEEKILVTPTEEALEDLLSIIPQESLINGHKYECKYDLI